MVLMNIGDSIQVGFDRFFGFLPNLVGCLVLLIVGYIVAKIVSSAARKLLEKGGIDRRLRESQGGVFVDRMLPGTSVSRGIARLLFWFIFAFFVVAAIGVLQIDALTGFMNDALHYLPNVIVAILIFLVAAALAGAAGSAATRILGNRPIGRIAGSVLPALVMVIALFMILDQLQIAGRIVTIAFAATMFAIALGLALAFGLGGRDLARRMLEDAYDRGREQRDESAGAVPGDMYGRRHDAGYPPGASGTTGITGTPRTGGYAAGRVSADPDTPL